MEEIFKGTNLSMANDYAQEDFCQVKKSFELTQAGIFGILIVIIFIALMIFGTFSSNSFLDAFCVKKNFLGLFKESKSGSFKYLRGYKGSHYLFVIYMHARITKYYTPYGDSRRILEMMNGFNMMRYTGISSTGGTSIFVTSSAILATSITIDLIKK
jgi:hypothetical protein